MRVITRQQMQDAEQQAMAAAGVSSAALMERAGREVSAVVETCPARGARRRVAVVCGRGQNGGDGFVAARVLARARADVDVVIVGRASDVTGDARGMLDSVRGTAARVFECPDAASLAGAAAAIRDADVVVDALVGTGLRGPLEGLAAQVVESIRAATGTVVAVDVPSGLVADRADVPGPAVRADITVTFAAPKPALVLPPASALAGRLVVADIGIAPGIIDALTGPRVDMLTADVIASLLPRRRPDSHKGDYGHVLVVAGSIGMTGAAALTGLSALRSGAGLVTVATPVSCQAIVAAYRPELMTMALPETTSGAIAERAATVLLERRVDVIAIGPGLGRDPATLACVRSVCRDASIPVVIDADALAAFAGNPAAIRRPDGPARVITPHEGEMARLIDTPVASVRAARLALARDTAEQFGVHVVLKGQRTIVADPGGSVGINPTGNPGMATAGSGDVLTGAIAAWLAQTGDPSIATRIAVHLHGLAGDLAAASRGEVGLIAGDIIESLGPAALMLRR